LTFLVNFVAVQLKSMVGIPLSDLQNLQRICLQTLQGTLQVGQSYGIGERHYNLANLTETTELLAAVNYAIRLQTPNSPMRNRVFPNFGPRQGWRFGGWGAY
jgi:hypothetical protein